MSYRVAILICLLVPLSSANAQTPAGQANVERESPASAQSINAAFQRALAAKRKGDYAAVLREMMPFAERGNADAQTIVGSLYDRGTGVAQNYTEAVLWNRRAAEQGNDAGQYYLGVMYGLGRGGLREDRVTSYMWLSLAAAQGNDDAAKARDKIADFMSPAQLGEAKKRASEWKPGTIASQPAATPQATPQPGPTPLVGYGHVSRSDGLKTFFVAGTFPNTSECERVSKIFSDNWVNSASRGAQRQA